jgi:hypothetical protein
VGLSVGIRVGGTAGAGVTGTAVCTALIAALPSLHARLAAAAVGGATGVLVATTGAVVEVGCAAGACVGTTAGGGAVVGDGAGAQLMRTSPAKTTAAANMHDERTMVLPPFPARYLDQAAVFRGGRYSLIRARHEVGSL